MNDDLNNILTVPNILTLLRLVLLPIIIIMIYAGMPWSAFALYVIAAATDFLDGYLARKMDAVTPFGTFLDPISDKIFVCVLLIALVDHGELGGFLVIPVMIILIREFLISGLREFLGPKDVQIPVSEIAKWKTTIQMVALGFLILGGVSIICLFAGWFFITAAAGITAFTGFLYMQAAWEHLK